MHLLWKRYSRSGYAPPWFYIAVGAGFAALAVWALVQRDWLVAAIALAMIAVTVGGSRIMRRLGEASAASRRAVDAERRKDG
jgi:hypothetical protein